MNLQKFVQFSEDYNPNKKGTPVVFSARVLKHGVDQQPTILWISNAMNKDEQRHHRGCRQMKLQMSLRH